MLARRLAQVGDWRNLEDLNVRNNELKVLPPEMGKWAKLQRMFAGGNHVVELPPEVLTAEHARDLRPTQPSACPHSFSCHSRRMVGIPSSLKEP